MKLLKHEEDGFDTVFSLADFFISPVSKDDKIEMFTIGGITHDWFFAYKNINNDEKKISKIKDKWENLTLKMLEQDYITSDDLIIEGIDYFWY